MLSPGKLFDYDTATKCFQFDFSLTDPVLLPDDEQIAIAIPLVNCLYRMTDYTLQKKQPIELHRVLLKLGVIKCLQRELQSMNALLQTIGTSEHPLMEPDELGKVRCMELLSNCGVFQKASELILKQLGKLKPHNNDLSKIPRVCVDGLDDFLETVEEHAPCLQQARDEINANRNVNFFPGLAEWFCPGSKLVCFPEDMDGTPVGCTVIQNWYSEDHNPATNTVKRRFILVVEYMVSVGTELVMVAATDVYPEFHDPTRSMPIKDLQHRKLDPIQDAPFLQRLQERGKFYASVSTHNHYLEYHPDSFFPIIGGGWNSNAVRPLSKGGRVMVDVRKGIVEGHIPVRGNDGLSDTVKEAIKLFESSKRTGVAVPFRTIDPKQDAELLWQSWPMLVGFSFTSRTWGKLLLSLPRLETTSTASGHILPQASQKRLGESPQRASSRKFGVQVGALGGSGSCGNCGYICFQEQAFEQLVLEEDKKELIRAVARNAGGDWDKGAENDEDGFEAEEDVGIDVVANKGAASIFLLHGPPGCGKTLTAEAISELLRKPLYIVTAGDLGITAKEVETTLGSVLDLCQQWDALVLIDEADIFLEARNSSEVLRNALVCVMLRLLEYYSGCLFLSSNRSASSIDPAIASRITVMLGYPPLDQDGRAKVWKNLVELVPAQPKDPETGAILETIASNKISKFRVEFSDEDYSKLAGLYQLNGRQIKNSIVLARALARERGVPLGMEVLHRSIKAVAGEQSEIVQAY